jgi:hypothetical protein
MRSPVWCKSIQLIAASGFGPSHLQQIPSSFKVWYLWLLNLTFAVNAKLMNFLPVEAYDIDMKQKAVMA